LKTHGFFVIAGGFAMLGCSSSSDPDYQFGVADMEQAVVGTWSGMWGSDQADAGTNDADVSDDAAGDAATIDAGTGLVPFTLVIEHPVPTGAHPLCDPRQFASQNGSGASFHPLCVSTSDMPIRATLNVSDGSFTGVELTGELRVPGARLQEADLSLRATTADVAIVAQWFIGKWLFCIANHTSGIPLASCRLESRS
jgi:hypothetical protein